jgi:hypothetical protein
LDIWCFSSTVADLWNISMIEILDGPLYVNHCEHKSGSYIGSLRYVDLDAQRNAYEHSIDIYIDENGTFGQSMCIRNSDDPADYNGLGKTADIFYFQHHEPYRSIIEFLKSKGNFIWLRSNDKSNTPTTNESTNTTESSTY